MKTFFSIIGGIAAFGLFCLALAYFQHWMGKRRWAKLSVGERLGELVGRPRGPINPKGLRRP